jgi:hypothetical protein
MKTRTPCILIYEYFFGGGWSGSVFPPGYLDEGTAMLRAAVEDFKSWGRAKIITTRDIRLPEIAVAAHKIVPVTRGNHDTILKRLAGECTAALIIAPENNGILAGLSQTMKNHGLILLGSSPCAINTASDKWECFKRFSRAGLATPKTLCVSNITAPKAVKELGLPLVVKPSDGADCDGVMMVRNEACLAKIFNERNHIGLKKFYGTNMLVQPYIEGIPISVSLMVGQNKSRVLSLNRQFINIDQKFTYQGGKVPFSCDNKEAAMVLAQKAAKLIPGLNGYVGVDMIMDRGVPWLVEINPRLTTSYIGLRKAADINLARAIWENTLEKKLPEKLIFSGSFSFINPAIK